MAEVIPLPNNSDISLLPTTFQYYDANLIEYLRINLPDDYKDFLESNRARVLLDAVAYEMSLVAFFMNANLRQMFLPTASTRESMFLLGKLVNYTLRGAIPSSVIVTFFISEPNALDIPIDAGTQVQVPGNPPIIFETVNDFILLAGNLAIDIPVVQGQTIEETIGVTSALSSPGQTFTSSQPPLLSTISLSIQNIPWTLVDNLFDAGPLDRVYTAKPNSESLAVFTFGNNIFGVIPPPSEPIIVTYRVGGGVIGNVVSNTITEVLSTIQDTGFNVISISVININAATEGMNQETIEEARVNIPRFVRSMDRFVSREDFQSLPSVQNLLSGANGSIFKSTATVQYLWAVHLVTIYILNSPPTGLLNPSVPTQALLDEVRLAVEQRTLETIAISVLPATLIAVDIVGIVYFFGNFRQDIVSVNVNTSLNQLFDPTRRDIGDGMRLSDLYAAIDNSIGVDYVDLTTPNSNFSAGQFEFIVLGTVSLSYVKTRI